VKDFYTNCSIWGNNLLYRGIRNGERISERVPYQPTLFVPSNKSSKFKTLDGSHVEKICPGGIYDTKDFIEKYKDVEGFKIFGNTSYQYCHIADSFPGEVEYDRDKIIIANIDIETSSENGFPEAEMAAEQVLSICVKMKGKYNVFGCGAFDSSGMPDVTYKKFLCERDLLIGFLDFWSNNYPDAITGWACSTYDIPYLVNRITNVCGATFAKKLSPWRNFTQKSITIFGKQKQIFSLVGISMLDYMELYKKFAKNSHQESYKLNHIANVELGESKLSFEEYGTLRKLYKENYQKYIEYNIKDVNLVDNLDNKLKLIDLVLGMAYDAKVNYDDVFGQVRVWDSLIFNELKKDNIVVPSKCDKEAEPYTGGYVKEPIRGLHKWVACFDANSLYPSLIQMFNISPDALCDNCAPVNVTVDDLLERKWENNLAGSITMAANGHTFQSNFTGFLSKMMKRLYLERKEYKGKMLDSMKELERVKLEIQTRGLKV